MKPLPSKAQMQAMPPEQRRYWLQRHAARHSPLRPHELPFAAGRRWSSLSERLPLSLRGLA